MAVMNLTLQQPSIIRGLEDQRKNLPINRGYLSESPLSDDQKAVKQSSQRHSILRTAASLNSNNVHSPLEQARGSPPVYTYTP